MKREKRRYMARLDDGHDYSEVVFESAHRANSRANYDDCKEQLRKMYGRSATSKRIMETFRYGGV